jgi:nucleoside-diphosphate-sugar epimerase
MHQTVSILGCGWLGKELGKKLISKEIQVNGSTTVPGSFEELKPTGIKPYIIRIEPGWSFVPDIRFFETDVLVISIPPPRVENINETFPMQIKEIIRLVNESGTDKVLFISSTSVYESSNNEVQEGQEGNPEQPNGKALLIAEKMLMEADFQTTIVRFAGLIGPGRNPARFYAGRENIPGNVPVNLIHLTDCVNILTGLIGNNIWGEVFNACCPEHPLRKDFYTRAAEYSGLPVPQFINAQEKYKIVNSNKVQNRLKYTFVYPNPLNYLKELK